MAIMAKYTRQCGVVLSDDQDRYLRREADRRRVSKARVIREALDERYGLVDGEDSDAASDDSRLG